MSMYNYGIGGNEVKVDANESIAEIPSNRTLIVQKLTDEDPVRPRVCVRPADSGRCVPTV